MYTTAKINKGIRACLLFFLRIKNKKMITGKRKAEVIFEKPILVASGQSCVIYDKDICLGGGVVV